MMGRPAMASNYTDGCTSKVIHGKVGPAGLKNLVYCNVI